MVSVILPDDEPINFYYTGLWLAIGILFCGTDLVPYYRSEVCEKLGADAYIGLPAELDGQAANLTIRRYACYHEGRENGEGR
jgi:hypothetical protein